LTHEKKPAEPKQKKKPNKERLLWIAAAIFIAGTIAFLLVIDAIYAPKAHHSAAPTDAVSE
jgi:uncharacterized membrane-anchored protein